MIKAVRYGNGWNKAVDSVRRRREEGGRERTE
jgi:hypothetical protein